MRLSEDIDFTTLTWVKSELDETLKQARHALEAYVEDPTDASQMRFCATYLHQVQGTLRMVELYGAAMVTEEMEQLATALLENDVGERDEAYTVLMRGIVQLPDYLERLQSGHRDIPIVLLPLLNELRGARGEKGLSESVLFTPDLGRPLPDAARGPDRPMPELELRQLAEALRKQFQVSLLNWFRGADADANVDKMAQVCDRLVSVTQQEEARRLFWVAAGVLEALRAKAFEASPQLKQTVGKVEREIKRLADAGETSFRVDPPRELTRNLLYFVAHAPTEHGRIGELRQVFRLDSLLPSDAELEHARGAMAGHNRALLDTVSGAIKEDLLRVKDALDLHLRSSNAQAADLSAQVDVLDRVADTLGMLGLGVARRVVQEQRDAVHQVSSGSRPADESTLLDIAGALLYVEASLDDQVQHLGGPVAGASGEPARALPQADARKVVEAVLKEAQANFAQAKQCFVAFVESSWDHAQLQDVPRLLEEVAGALRIMELVDAPQYLTGVRRFTENELLARRRVPNGQQMDTLADALASLEYYLEALRDQRPNRDRILDVTRESLEGLGYWPVPDLVEVTPEDAAAAVPAAASLAPPAADVEVLADDAQTADQDMRAIAASADALPSFEGAAGPERQEPAVAAPAAEAPAQHVAVGPAPQRGFEATTDDIDEEIREVFIEEVQEEIANLQQLLPVWKGDPSNLEQLKPIRRVFHTLKGSGRLVGAISLGEFSWKVENMLNRVLDGTVPAVPAALALVEHAQEMLPGMLSALRGEAPSPAGMEAVKAVADRIAAGEQAFYEPVVEEPLAGGVAVPADAFEGEASAVATPDADTDADAGLADEFAEVPAGLDESPAGEAAAAAEAVDAERPRLAVLPIDPVLFEILRAEVAGHLEAIDEYLARCVPAPVPVDDPLLRAIHTMNGAFAMTEVPTITEVVSPLEGFVKRLLAQGAAPSPAGLALLGEAVAAVRETMAELDAGELRLPLFEPLAEQIAAARDLLPEPAGPSIPVHLDEIEDGFLAPQAPAMEQDARDQHAGAADAVPESAAADDSAVPEGEVAAGEEAGAEAEDETFEPEIISLGEAEGAASALGSFDFELVEFEHGGDAPAEPAAQDLASPNAVELPDEGHDAALAALFAAHEAPADAPSELDALALEADASDAGRRDATDMQAGEGDDQGAWEAALAAADQAREEDFGREQADQPVSGDAGEDVRAAAEEQARQEALEREQAEEMARMEAEEAARRAAEEQARQEAFEREQAEEMARMEAEEAARLAAEEQARQEAFEREQAEEMARMEAEEAARLAAEEQARREAFEREQAEEMARMEAEEAARLAAEEQARQEAFEREQAEEQARREAEEAARLTAEEQARQQAFEREQAEEMARMEAEEATRLAAAAPEQQSAEQAAEEAAEEQRADAQADAERQATAAWATIDDPDAPMDMGDLDEELLDIFLEEGGDILDHSDGLLASLRQNPSDRELVVGLQRDLHTLKGGARMAGLPQIGDLGHAMESLLEAVADGRRELHGSGVEVLERAFDRLHAMVTRVGDRRAVAMPTLLIDRVEALVRGEVLEAPVPVTSVPATAPQPEEPSEAATLEPAPLSAPVEEEDEVAAVSRAPQEQIRIRADLLDRLVNYAGEVAIYRARLEQQLGTFRGSLTELEATTSRLREQLRRLEIETEAQIIARYQREAEVGESSFDPLELDRFSTLQQLSRALGESAADLVNLQGTLDDQTRQYETLLLQQSRVSSELQEGLMRTRMVPFDALVPRLRRILRQTCGELGKKAQLRVDGAQGEMDRNVLDRMTAPLEHMLRNAIAHGMETPKERKKAGKPEEGTVRIVVSREASEVVIRVSDDGRGMDRDAIRRKALERGLMKPDAHLSDRDLYGFVLETGFSTAETVSKIAGRGVGMDVVNSEIKQLGGSLYIESQRGEGTEFIIRLPFTLAVTQAVFVKLGETSFAVPISSVQGVARINRAELEAQLASGDPSYEYAGEQYAIYDLGLLLGQAHVRAEDSLQVPLLLARSGDLLAAICVDQVIGSREIVVKPSGPQVSSIPGIFGATVMGDGRVVVILDVAPLVRRSAALQKSGDAPVLPAVQEVRRIPLVMVVDDSITMRKVTGRVLERHNYEVMTAKDGVDAIEKLQDRLPDVMLLDIEMPRMDGYELATHMRNDPRLRDVPIIMITSRTGEKHRQRAFEIGVDRYLGKPYQEAELMRNVTEILEVGRGVVG